jgi:hypothetical protein
MALSFWTQASWSRISPLILLDEVGLEAQIEPKAIVEATKLKASRVVVMRTIYRW